jgi:hypothetical protein
MRVINRINRSALKSEEKNRRRISGKPLEERYKGTKEKRFVTNKEIKE